MCMMTHNYKIYKGYPKYRRYCSVEFDFEPGKKYYVKTYSELEAAKWAEAFIRGEIGMAGNMITFGDFASSFYSKTGRGSFHQTLKARRKEYDEDYFKIRQSYVDNYLIPEFGKRRLDSITPLSIQNFLFSVKSKNGEELSSATIDRLKHILSTILGEALIQGYIKSNPCMDVPAISVRTENERRALTLKEQLTLFPSDIEERVKIWKDISWAVYFSIMYDTGFRPGEVAGLRVKDVYETPGGLAVCTMQEVKGTKLVQRVKTTGKGLNRRVGLLYSDTAKLVKMLIAMYDLSGSDLLIAPYRMPKGNAQLLRCDSSNKHFKTICAEHGIEGVTQYCMRHTYETGRRGDLSDEILAVSMGHTKLRDDYDHRTDIDMIRTLEGAREDLFRVRERREVPEAIRRLKR